MIRLFYTLEKSTDFLTTIVQSELDRSLLAINFQYRITINITSRFSSNILNLVYFYDHTQSPTKTQNAFRQTCISLSKSPFHKYSGFPLVLLHGGAVFLESFAVQIPLLARSHKIIAIDSRGHGRSARVEKPLNYDTLAKDVIVILAALEITQANFVGWSDGGNTSMAIALTYPERVRKLVLISANYHPSGVLSQPDITHDDSMIEKTLRFFIVGFLPIPKTGNT